MTTTKPVTARLQERFPDVDWVKVPPPEAHPAWSYPGFAPDTTTVLPAGHKKAPENRAFGVPTVFMRDLVVPMRDGTNLYTDVFLPESEPKVPAILAWSPYGKQGSPMRYDTMSIFNCGVDQSLISGYQKFEGPCPAVWAEKGYAIVNIDSRGAARSEGDLPMWGPQEVEDIYDTIDWLVAQPWCNGSVVMTGNSWLAISQFNFASRLKHPGLKAIAPWEGATNQYRDIYMRGGFPHLKGFTSFILKGFTGQGKAEDVGSARPTHPFYDEYWETKTAHVENIDIPMYVTSSYSSGLHIQGSFEAFEKAKTTKKWLRNHPYQEWYDLYRPEMVEDLQRFYDTYAKGIDNGWERDTPKVRLSLLGFDGSLEPTILERPETNYPVPRTSYTRYYLDASSGTLTAKSPSTASTVSHEGHSLTATSDFKVVFDRRTEIAGYSTVKLWMSCAEHDDMDVVVQIRKVDRDGNLLSSINYPIPVPASEVKPDEHTNVSTALGPQGQLRASHAVSRDASVTDRAVYLHNNREPVPRAKVVPLEITLWPMGMVFGAGEGLVLRVSGHSMTLPEFKHLALVEPDDENVGTHVVHAGGEYDSWLELPVLPEDGK